MEEEINVAELNQFLSQSSENIFLIDLMNSEDFAGNHIPGAINIPVEELKDRIAEIPKDKDVVVVCRRGLMKSDLALQQLHESGFTTATKMNFVADRIKFIHLPELSESVASCIHNCLSASITAIIPPPAIKILAR